MKNMNKNIMKIHLFALTAAAAALTLTACSGQPAPAGSAPETQTPAAAEPASTEPAAPVQAAPAEADTPVQTAPAEPETPARTVSYVMLLQGSEATVYPDVSDTEIVFWDSASAGQIIAVAKYAQPMSGAADALRDCDFTDLDEDGNSDLTANFSFPDGTTASLLWFYTDGGFVYNAEFSLLPGDAPAGDAE